jgi:hypothetical protein
MLLKNSKTRQSIRYRLVKRPGKSCLHLPLPIWYIAMRVVPQGKIDDLNNGLLWDIFSNVLMHIECQTYEDIRHD